MKKATQTFIRLIKPTLFVGLLVFSELMLIPSVLAAPGDPLGTVLVPGSDGGDPFGSVGGTVIPTAGGLVYVATQGLKATNLLIYDPPENGEGDATLLATKALVNGSGEIKVNCIAWDPTRQVLWGAISDGNGPVYHIDLGDITVSGNAHATFQFNSNLLGEFDICDGIAYDQERDTLWISPDLDLSVFEFGLGDKDPLGALLSTVSPKNVLGVADGNLSGVVVGKGDTLYVGRSLDREIRRVDKNTGNFISDFAFTTGGTTGGGHVEDLTCDPVTYAPKEAILAKINVGDSYEAFEVEKGTCSLPVVSAFKWYFGTQNPPFTADNPRLPFATIARVSLNDQFASRVMDVRVLKGLLTPSGKNQPVDPARRDHLSCYSITNAPGQPPFFAGRIGEVQIETENFGEDTLRLGSPLELCISASKNDEFADVGDFLCYNAHGNRRDFPNITLDDQFFENEPEKIRRLSRFCTPVGKNKPAPPTDPEAFDHLACYELTSRFLQPFIQVDLVDEFIENAVSEDITFTTKLTRRFCEPARKIVLSCEGQLPTIVGTSGPDVINGTPADDVIVGLEGDDTIMGGGGDDIICGGDGNDGLNGDDGDDILDGGPGDDGVHGNAGNDEVRGGDGIDIITGGDGDDLLLGGAGDDASLQGDAGNDVMDGGDGDDGMNGGSGIDSMFGSAGNDTMTGGDGDDFMQGGTGNDFLQGLIGNDFLGGGDGDDELHGNEGNDTMNGGSGHDILFGENGSDTLSGGPDTDNCDGGPGTDFGGAGCENIISIP